MITKSGLEIEQLIDNVSVSAVPAKKVSELKNNGSLPRLSNSPITNERQTLGAACVHTTLTAGVLTTSRDSSKPYARAT